jgi:hypothetical protein
MIILNNSETETRTITRARYQEAMNGFTTGTDVMTGRQINDLDSFTVSPKTAMIIELK